LLGASSILSMSLSLRAVMLYKSAAMLIVILFDSLLVLTVILPGVLNSNIVSSGMLKSRAAFFLGELTLGFPDSLTILIAILYNCLALTNILSSSLTWSSSILSNSLSRSTAAFLAMVLSSLSYNISTPFSTSLPI
jgi:hypothetical protein